MVAEVYIAKAWTLLVGGTLGARIADAQQGLFSTTGQHLDTVE